MFLMRYGVAQTALHTC